jgi:diacylglycerol kinase
METFKNSNNKNFFKSFYFAISGLKLAFKERNFKIFCFIAVLVILLMFLFKVSLFEKIILILTISFTMALELINTQIEKTLDFLHPSYHPKIKAIKDISAGAVLIMCLGSAIVGILIFLPYFLKIFRLKF